jgi:linoleoyl-CoA desaturase
MKQKSRIRFTNKDKSKFFTTLKANVDAYFEENNISKHANAHMVWKSIILISGFLLPFITMLLIHENAWQLFLSFSVMGFCMAGIGMSVMHDAAHNAYTSNATVNRYLSYSLNLIGGAVFNWKIQHNVLHHTYTNIHGMDDDIDSKVMMRFSPHGQHRGIHRFQHIYIFFFYSIITLYWVTFKDFVQYVTFRKNGMHRGSVAEHRKNLFLLIGSKAIYFFYLLVVPIVFFHYSIGIFVCGFITMHVICGLILSVIFQLAHTVEGTSYPMPNEKSEVENDWAIHQMHTTVDFARDNKFVTWYIGGLNFQVEHHLFPNICHVHYKNLAPIVKSTAEEFGIPYLDNPGFWDAVASHLRALKKFGMSTEEALMAA